MAFFHSFWPRRPLLEFLHKNLHSEEEFAYRTKEYQYNTNYDGFFRKLNFSSHSHTGNEVRVRCVLKVPVYRHCTLEICHISDELSRRLLGEYDR